MADMKGIIRLMKELEDQLVVCMRCGMCQAVCPLYAQTGREADVARGKLALLDGLLKEMFDDPQGVAERLNKCLLCGSCAANCPSGVRVLDIFLKARAILTGYSGLSPAKQLVLRGMLSRPELFDRLAEWGAKFQPLFTRPVNETVGTSCARLVSPLLQDRHFRPLAPVPFHREVPKLDTKPASAQGLRVAVFVGCLIDKIFPTVGRATVKVLRHHGAGIFLPDGQGCCGIPALSAGDTETFDRLLRRNLERFELDRFDHLVTACATCTSTIKEVWPVMADRFDKALQQRVAQLAEKTLDISQFLVTKLGIAGGKRQAEALRGQALKTVTVHDPCHLKKGLGVFREPRALIEATDGYRIVEMAEADACCGMGGSFNLQYYEISSGIGRLKRENIRATGCSQVATGCPACMLQISEALSKAGDRIAVRHPVEIYAEAIDT
jgi:glycolate oxidase iron-sulfur subunit